MLKLIKPNIEYKKCAKDVKESLEAIGFITDDEKDMGQHFQFRVTADNQRIGYIRFYPKKDGSTTIDISQINESWKERIKNGLKGVVDLDIFKEGKIPLGTRTLNSQEISQKVKEVIFKKFPELTLRNINDQIFDYRMEGNNLVIIQYRIGTILFQGKKTAFSDKVISEIDKIIQEEQRHLLLARIKEQVEKEDYEQIEKALAKRQVTLKEFISPELYSFISGCGSHLLQDGLTIFQVIKEQNITLKDYGSILRNFAILFEDFLIDWLLRLNLLNQDNLKIDVRTSFIGSIINGELISNKFKYCYIRLRPKFHEKLKSTYQECRHDLLHADKFKYEPISSFDKANSKLHSMIDCMEDCVNLFKPELKFVTTESDTSLSNSNIIGIDESGKGDLFGPLVVAGVYIDKPNKEVELRQIGVKDSKIIDDSKIFILAKEIKRICKFNVVRINPEKYNSLYNDIKNLNTLLGWGHARVIENMLNEVNANFVISDKFGDESFINSKLMEKGKKIKLIQKVKAEENIAVAAASIIAREEFLFSLERLSKEWKVMFPRGGGNTELDKALEEFIGKHSKDNLNKVAKVHFKNVSDKLN